VAITVSLDHKFLASFLVVQIDRVDISAIPKIFKMDKEADGLFRRQKVLQKHQTQNL
jgi:hypothetical protein